MPIERVAPQEDEEDDLAGLGLGASDDEQPAEEHEPEGEEADQLQEGGEGQEEDDNASVQADEAEEDAPAPKRKRTDAQERQALREDVRALVAGMESAITKDAADVAVGKPATRKLTMLHVVRTTISVLAARQLPASIDIPTEVLQLGPRAA